MITNKDSLIQTREWRNADGKRVCDISGDRRTVFINIKGCSTRITANSDGTLSIVNLPAPE